jgi:membrane protein required for colicin V production
MFIDIIFILILLYAIFKGYSKGLIVAIFSFFAFIIGLAAALKLSTKVAIYLEKSTSTTSHWMPIVSFFIVMFIVIFVVRLGAVVVEKTIDLALMGWVNKLGGIALYASLYLMFYSVVLFYADKMSIIEPETIASSSTFAFIKPWGPTVINGFGAAIPWFKNMFTQLENFFALHSELIN